MHPPQIQLPNCTIYILYSIYFIWHPRCNSLIAHITRSIHSPPQPYYPFPQLLYNNKTTHNYPYTFLWNYPQLPNSQAAKAAQRPPRRVSACLLPVRELYFPRQESIICHLPFFAICNLQIPSQLLIAFPLQGKYHLLKFTCNSQLPACRLQHVIINH
jgi:hypothetical protein